MQLNLRRILVLFFFLVTFLGLRFAAATACVLVPLPTVLDEYERADVVITARVVSTEKAKEPDPDNLNNHYATMVVQRVFKGKVKVQDALRFASGNGIDCLWQFDEKDIGREFLLYVEAPDEATDFWYVGQGRSLTLSNATNDLRYLNNLDKVRGQTRVSGTLYADIPLAGKKVRIIGEGKAFGKNKTFQAITDEHGVYEIYGLPPGKYLIAPEMPYGWMIDRDESVPTVSERPMQSKLQKAFRLQAKRHAVVDFAFKIDNALEGHVYDQNGRPKSDANIALVPEDNDLGERSQFIGEKGQFKFESVPAGKYKLMVYEDKPDSGRISRSSDYDPQKSNLLTTLTINLKQGESMRGLKIIVSTKAGSSTR